MKFKANYPQVWVAIISQHPSIAQFTKFETQML